MSQTTNRIKLNNDEQARLYDKIEEVILAEANKGGCTVMDIIAVLDYAKTVTINTMLEHLYAKNNGRQESDKS